MLLTAQRHIRNVTVQVHRNDWSSVRVTMHWIGVVICSLMCGAASVASLRFIIIDAKVR